MGYRLLRKWCGWVGLATLAVIVMSSASAGARSPEKIKIPGMTPGTRVLKVNPLPKSTDVASVAVSRAGTVLVVGQPGNYDDRSQSGTMPGSVYVFVRASHTSRWRQKAVLAAPAGNVAGNGFGQAVAVSAKGDEIAVGAPGSSVGGHAKVGAIYVFTRSAGGWSSSAPVAGLTPSDPADSAGIGDTVGISGATVVAGNGRGQPVYVFERDADSWTSQTQKAELTAPQIPGGCQGSPFRTFGSAVAVDGRTVAVGFNTYPSAGCTPSGAVLVFDRPSGGWANTNAPTAMLRPKKGGAGELLGSSLALQGDTLVAGAPDGFVNNIPRVGAVYVFEKPHGGWHDASEIARLSVPFPFANDLLGGNVGISGNTIVASNALCPNGPVNCPFVFTKSAGHWGAKARELVPPTSSQRQGVTPTPLAVGGGMAFEVAEVRKLPVVVFRVSKAGKT